nr:unnamed protein product [Digitaria exilis]
MKFLFLVLVCLVASSELLFQIHGQVDYLGFISIDCGIAANSSYSEQSSRGLLYVSDAGYVDAGDGLNAFVRPPYDDPDMAERYRTVRFFPGGGGGERSCYTLGPVSPGGKYLVRTAYCYGNYDGLNELPVFDLHLGVNLWATINVTAAADKYIHEAVTVAPADFLQVCLVNRGLGTPFISGLDLRPLRSTMYPEATANQSLLMLSLYRPSTTFVFNRYQFWTSAYQVYRYPFDPYDRLWQTYGDIAGWTNITTSATVEVSNITSFDKPTIILESASIPVNATRMDFTWSTDPSIDSDDTPYLLMLYFAELQRVPSSALRRFDILVDNATWNGSQHYTPKYLSAEVVKKVVQGSGQHDFSLVATPDATLPPILNAFEIYSVTTMNGIMTNDADAKAMMTIRTNYGLKKNWMGDPCAPKAFAWDGLKCSYPSSGPAWVTALRLSSSGLTGAVDSSFGDLKSLQYLDLSNNSLYGPIPDFLAQMPSLAFLIGNNVHMCADAASTCGTKKERNRILVIATVVPIAVATLLFVIAFLIIHKMRKNQGDTVGATALTWHHRLKIAIDSAHGLEYLHKSCQPPLIHRDVKTKNILLSADLVAKIADFGLMKAFADEFRTHVTTQPAGTLGYLDPEYYNTSQLSEKSDVYSFGVVLLELITGQPSSVPISNTESIHVAQWVRQKLSEGDITGIAGPRMGGYYDVNSVWKVTELALQCKEQPSRKRPTMTDVVLELKECLELEVSHATSYESSVPSSANNISATSVDLKSDVQASYPLGQQTVLDLEQVGEASASDIGPAPR